MHAIYPTLRVTPKLETSERQVLNGNNHRGYSSPLIGTNGWLLLAWSAQLAVRRSRF